MNRLLLLLCFTCSFQIVYSQTSVELNGGTKRLGIDLLSYHYLDTANRWSVYNHDRAVAYYDSKLTSFLTVNSIIYSFKLGWGITANLVGDNTHFYTSVGLQYEKIIKSLYLYFLSTYETKNNFYIENYVFIVYKAKLTEKIKWISQNEFYVSFIKLRNDISLQRIKLGIEIGQTQLGLISETYQLGSHYETALVNLGLYVKRAF